MMNETLRKRLVGAAVLIALGILLPFGLVQWLGEAPSYDGDSVRVYEITPEGRARPVAEAEPAPAAPESAPAEPDAAAPAAENADDTPSSGPEPDAGREAKPAKPAVSPPSPDTGKPPPEEPAAGPSWSVQVGSFRSRDNAESLMSELAAEFPMFYTEVEVDGVTYYRVRVGPYDDEDRARRVAETLTARGRAAQVRREP